MGTNELPTPGQVGQPQEPSTGSIPTKPVVVEPVKPPEPVVEFRVRVKDIAVSKIESGIGSETEIAKTTSAKLFPRTPYYVDEDSRAVVMPSFVIGDLQARRSGDMASLFAHSKQVMSMTDSEITSLKPKEVVLVPLPVPGDTMILQPGTRVEGAPHENLVIFQDKGQFFVRDVHGSVTQLPSEFRVTTHEEKVKEKVITSPMERQGEVTAREELLKKDTTGMVARVVKVDGIVALMIEGNEGTNVQVGRATLDSIKAYYEKLASRTEQFKGGVLVSTPSKKHPTRNEDAAFRTADGVNVVLDGMGSYQAGGIRTGYEHSHLAEVVVRESLAARGEQKDVTRQQEAFVGALVDAHNVLQRNLPMDGDTTGVLSRIMMDNKKRPVLVWANVGDSRVMVVRNGEIIPVSQDDNVLTEYFHGKQLDSWIDVPDKTQAQELFEAGFPYDASSGKVYFSRKQVTLMMDIIDRFNGFGMFAPDSFLGYFFKNSSVTRGLKGSMTNPRTDIHTGVMSLERGDIVLTMSDGISDPLSTEGLEMLVKKVGNDPMRLSTAIQAEVARANASISQYSQRGKEDDKSLVVEVVG